jgi:hypothetical protein
MKKLFDFKNLGSVLLMLSVFASSCKQEAPLNDLAPEATPTQRVMKYKIDGKEMSKDAFYGSFSSLLSKKSKDLNARSASESEMLGVIAEDNRVVWEIDRPESTGTSDVTNAFTSDQEYINYGQDSGYPEVAEAVEAYNHLRDYAVSSGTIAQVEATGVLPNEYMQYMDNYLASHGLPTSEIKNSSGNQLQTRSLTNMVYRGCFLDEGGLPVKIHPWLSMFGLNNNISSFEPIGFLGGRTDIYDRWFFSRHILGVWSWAQQKWTLCGGQYLPINPFSTNFTFANDRATSWSAF